MYFNKTCHENVMGGSRGGTGGSDPAEKSQNYNKTGPDPIKIHTATKPAINVLPAKRT